MSYQTSYDPVSMRWSLSDGSHYLELPEWAREILADEHERETKQLKTENAKLRELIASMEDDMREPGVDG